MPGFTVISGFGMGESNSFIFTDFIDSLRLPFIDVTFGSFRPGSIEDFLVEYVEFPCYIGVFIGLLIGVGLARGGMFAFIILRPR